MRTVSDLLALAGAKLAADAPSLAPDDRPDGSLREKSTLADVGARIGEDNEALRNLLIDTSHHLGTIDTLKETFGQLVDPLHNVLTALEKERAQHASTKGALAAFRSSQEALRADLQALEKTAAELKDDKTKLGRALEAAQQRVRELEDDKTRLNGEVAAARAATAKTVKQLEEQTANVRSLSEEKRLLSDRGDLADKRVITLEAEVALARERLALLESDDVAASRQDRRRLDRGAQQKPAA
jgi:crescentin